MATSIKVAAAKIVEQRTHQIPGKLRVTEHFFDVPKDYSKPDSGTIRIFARSVRKHESPADPSDHDEKKSQLPWMVFLNGGPGGPCRHPSAYPFTWTILDKGYQMLYLDQRGTGLSTPITPSTLGLRGENDVQAKYLKLFRADSIVRDCEAIRQSLTADYPPEKQKWSIMGQSFGGFCSITYLSFYPQGLREAFIYGGLQPLVKQPDPVYRALFKRVARRNQDYYKKYPEDVDRVKTIVRYLQRFGDGVIKLPTGGNLTARRFQQMGIIFGMHGGIDSVHEAVLRAAYDIEAFGHLTRGTLSAIDALTPFDEGVIYAILHEQIYCEGKAPNWRDAGCLRTTASFARSKTATQQERGSCIRSRIPRRCEFELMYVDYDYSRETAEKIKGCKTFTTNVMYHNAIRSKADEVIRQLFELRDDVID
ncbi:alpha/beta-hydrolase, partial [Aureobasidium melanogenum]